MPDFLPVYLDNRNHTRREMPKNVLQFRAKLAELEPKRETISFEDIDGLLQGQSILYGQQNMPKLPRDMNEI